MRHLHILILFIIANLSVSAANVTVDRQWYVAGEGVKLSIALDDKVSKVAYIELCDTTGVMAGDVIALRKGMAEATFILPKALHSGYYLLSVYTHDSKPQQLILPVVNTLTASTEDRIAWEETAGDNNSLVKNLPSTTQNHAISSAYKDETELYGHTVIARLKTPLSENSNEVSCTLSTIGKEIHVFNGSQVNDSTLLFYTYGISGKQQIVISAYDIYGKSLDVEVVSPYKGYVPASLPKMHFQYNRKEVEQRSIAMQQMNLERADSVKPAEYSDVVFNTKPVASYNLDEYRQFATVGESMLEFVGFVHESDKNGIPELFVYTEAEGYSSWAALVLIDGMPTNDIKRLMKYDARRVHHINIYNDRFALGKNNIYKGIVSIVTRSGNITNYRPDSGSAYIVYNFPH